jgi:biopolymer transport protein ExbD
MARRRVKLGSLESELNITPLIDVLIVLMVFFLVITPIILYSFNANLPQAGAAASAWKEEEEMIVTLTDNNLLQVNGVEVTEEGLVKRIEEFFPADSERERKVIFSGGKKANYEKVIQAMDVLKKNNIETIGIR